MNKPTANTENTSTADTSESSNFVAKRIEQDLKDKIIDKPIVRFPPEPNGYLHVGHAKSICLNFGLAEQFNGDCHLRFDDTNPEKESQEFIDAIKEDIHWLGFNWKGDVRFASDYFDTLYEWALELIKQGDAYVCELNAEQAREYRGTLTQAGTPSPYRNRSVEENLEQFSKMQLGELPEGHSVLRAKIDMASSNMNMRDPIIYRIRHIEHHQTGNRWKIYPTYDYTHGQSDAIEGITHSVCTLEFEDHRPLYEWFLEHLPVPCKPKQYEFGRLNLDYTVTSKRKLKTLVDEAVVKGWDDPRMPTISGMRRRGFSPHAIRHFCDMIGVSRSDGMVDVAMLEHAVRTDYNQNALRGFCIQNPLKVVIENLPEEYHEELDVPLHPELDLGSRSMPLSREIYIEQDDFKTEYSKRFKKKFCPDKRIRLRYAHVLEATGYETNEQGEVVLVRAKLIENTLGCDPEDGIKPRGVVHWLSVAHAQTAELRLYQRLFNDATPDGKDKDFMQCINPNSLEVKQAFIEPALLNVACESRYQFERQGNYVADRYDHKPGEKAVFNLAIGLREDRALSQN